MAERTAVTEDLHLIRNPAAAPVDLRPIITVDGLVKRFASRTILDGVTFAVRPGETVSILGRSGTGKSVLLKTIIALLDPDEGQVTVLGRNLHALAERERLAERRLMGYVFQGSALFDSLSVLDNVGFSLTQQRLGVDEIRHRVEEALLAVELPHVIDRFPAELSGGMQKRVGVARAIIDQPRVILYDEPTTGLDPITTDSINAIIQRLQRSHGVTSLVVTHDIRSALTISDRIIMFDQGRIIASGTPTEIQATKDPWVQRFIGVLPAPTETLAV